MIECSLDLRKKRVPEAYIKIIPDMYEECQTQVTTREGNTEYFNVKVGLHQGSAISPLLFIIIMDVLDTEPPWNMLFAKDLVLRETSKAALEREREREGGMDGWREGREGGWEGEEGERERGREGVRESERENWR